MKLLILTVLILSLTIGLASGQEIDTVKNNIIYVGARYDAGVLLSYGYATPLGILKFWTFNFVNLGSYGDMSSEIVYYFQPIKGFDKLSLGALVGANADWVESNDGQPDLMYLVGAAGILSTYDYNNTGVWGYAKYKFTTEPKSNNYIDGYAFGGGIHIWF